MVAKMVAKLIARVETHAQGDKRNHALTFQFIGSADDGSFRDRFVSDERALDFGGSEPMARNVEDVIDSANDPKIAVLISSCSVAGEIAALDFAPVPAS